MMLHWAVSPSQVVQSGNHDLFLTYKTLTDLF
jgi:hypothetical protein